MKHYYRGFTLVEVLATVAVISILATLSLGPIRAAQKRGRDTERKAHLNLIAESIDSYFADKRAYPLCSPPSVATSNDGASGEPWIPGLETYLTSTRGRQERVPRDPFYGTTKATNYYYTYTCSPSEGKTYSLEAILENTRDLEGEEVDGKRVYIIER